MSTSSAEPLTVAALQLEIADGEPARNLESGLDLAREATRAGARLLLLPELWTTGYAHDTWPSHADTWASRIIGRIGAFCREHEVFIGGSLIERNSDGALVNRFSLVGPDGNVGATYDKVHLFAPMQEDRHLAAGSRRVGTTIVGWQAALSVCFDLRFPELYRADAIDGAELFLVPSEWPASRADVMRGLAWARAVENQSFLVLANRTGTARDGERFAGGSLIVAPDGAVLAEAGSDPGFILGRIDRSGLSVRERIPVLAQRVPGVDTLP